MKFFSTRGGSPGVHSMDAVLNGLAPDGGLYMPENGWQKFDWQKLIGKPAIQMSAEILHHFLPEFENMEEIVRRAYAGKFETEDLTPLVPVGDRYVLELFRGPTSAFKDVALSVLPQLITAAGMQTDITDKIVILTATSGDTGKAALEGFHDVPGTGIIVFYPYGGVSAVQQAQMTTQAGNNVKVCAVRGNFDDAQTGVKNIFARKDILPEGGHVRLSSANSINIGRLAPQVVYYFKAYSDLVSMGRIKVGDLVDFTVPTGNFGDILAGYLAKGLGLPVGKLICASNANRVLTDFLETGVYDRRRPFYKTQSPSMDILVSSNLERLLYLLSGGDTELIASLMKQLSENGYYKVPEDMLRQLQREFAAGCADDAETDKAIARVWKQYHYLCDTHTAVAWAVSEQYTDSKTPNVVLSTASPYKFPTSVVSALGEKPAEDEFAVMEQLHALTGVPVPPGLAGLKEKTVLHKDVVERDNMAEYVREAVRG